MRTLDLSHLILDTTVLIDALRGRPARYGYAISRPDARYC